jgi:hypothetical protein
MANMRIQAIALAILCVPLSGCVTFSEQGYPGQKYERNPSETQSYDQIHENMDTAAYNRAAGDLARGKKARFERGVGGLETSPSQFNRQNAGNLRAISTCTTLPKSDSKPTPPCRPR